MSKETVTTKWMDGKTAPKDGSEFWAYLYQSGIRKLRWATPKEIAEHDGGEEDDYVGGFVQCDDFQEEWWPKFWLPLKAIPIPEAA